MIDQAHNMMVFNAISFCRSRLESTERWSLGRNIPEEDRLNCSGCWDSCRAFQDRQRYLERGAEREWLSLGNMRQDGVQDYQLLPPEVVCRAHTCGLGLGRRGPLRPFLLRGVRDVAPYLLRSVGARLRVWVMAPLLLNLPWKCVLVVSESLPLFGGLRGAWGSWLHLTGRIKVECILTEERRRRLVVRESNLHASRPSGAPLDIERFALEGVRVLGYFAPREDVVISCVNLSISRLEAWPHPGQCPHHSSPRRS